MAKRNLLCAASGGQRCTVHNGRAAALEQAGILGGLPVEGGILWCATEKASKEALDQTIAIVKEVLAQ